MFHGLRIWVLCLATMGCGSPTTSAPPSERPAYAGPPRPNSVVYLVDTLRADHLGAYGYDKDTSPHIDAFAAQGLLFERAIAPDTCTVGSAPSLLSGQYTVTHGVDDFGKRVNAAVPLLQTELHRHGYATGSFITNINAGAAAGLDRGFDLVHDAIADFRQKDALRTVPLAAIDSWLSTVGERPFLLYVHTAEPHRPYLPPTEYAERFVTPYEGPVTGVFRGARGYEHASTAADIQHVQELYDAEIALADAGFGSLLALLERKGYGNNTLVVFTSDHGEELYDHKGWNHGHTVHEELAHIPLVVTGPGVPSGRRVPGLVSLIDIAPSLLHWVGIEVPPSFEGAVLTRPHPDRMVFTRSSFSPRKMAVRQGHWSLHRDEHGQYALYDLRVDPDEHRSVATEHPEPLRQLSAALEQWASGQVQRPTRTLTDEETERLRVLGYIE